MSKITGSDALKMFEAYAEIYAPQEQEVTEEQIWEEVENWVNSLLEEGHDLSEYTWEEMYNAYIGEAAEDLGASARRAFGSARRAAGDVAGAYMQGFTGQKTTSTNPLARAYNAVSRTTSAPTRAIGSFAKGFVTGQGSTPAKPPVARTAPAAAPATKPPVARTAPAAAPAGQTGDKAKDMATWAKANPKLAAAAAEKARIRGTAQTDNPLIDKGMRSRMPVTPTVQSPTLKTDLGKSAGSYTSLTQNPAAGKSPTPPVKAATPSQATAAASSTSPSASGSLAPATAKIAAKPSPAMSQDAIRRQRLNMEMEYDAYDLVLEYLMQTGHAETVSEAHYLMLEMDEDMIGDIIEARAMAHTGGTPHPLQGAGGRPKGITGGTTYQMPGFDDDKSKKKKKS